MQTSTHLELCKLSKSYGNKIIVDGIDLKMKKGEFIALLGPSGCGKTTTLMMVAGLLKPTGGDIKINGKIVTNHLPKYRNVGMVFQTYALYPNMTVLENITFSLKLQKIPLEERQKRGEKIISMLHLSDHLHKKPGELSGGQQQRVSIGRALIREPDLLLFDEPLSNLDASLRIKLRGEIKNIQKNLGKTSLYVTHDQSEAMALADRIVILKEGKLLDVASPEDIYNCPKSKSVAEFVGVPQMNFFPVDIESKNDVLIAKNAYFNLPLDPSRRPRQEEKMTSMLFGIRPEDVRVATKGIQGQVAVVEPLGRDQFVTVMIGESSVSLLTSNSHRFKYGESIALDFDMKRAQFFDQKSEKSLLW